MQPLDREQVKERPLLVIRIVHRRWAGPPCNQGASRRSQSKTSFGAPSSLISLRIFGPLTVPQVALLPLYPALGSPIRTTSEIYDDRRAGPRGSLETYRLYRGTVRLLPRRGPDCRALLTREGCFIRCTSTRQPRLTTREGGMEVTSVDNRGTSKVPCVLRGTVRLHGSESTGSLPGDDT